MSRPNEAITGSTLAWLLLGIPAILGWVGYLLGWLLEPRIPQADPLLWAAYGAMGWYALMISIVVISQGGIIL